MPSETAKDPPKCAVGTGGVFVSIALPLWGVFVPLGVAVTVLALPFKLLRGVGRLVTGSPPKAKLGVEITGPAEKDAKDVLLFVHGWPDHGRLWDKQVRHLSEKGFRCIVVTIPGFDGAHVGWGYSFDAIADMLAQAIQEKVESKRVTLILHDWGCAWGYRLARRNPELVKRIVALDVAGHIALANPMKLFAVSYQLYNVVAFLLGSPGGDLMNRVFLMMGKYAARPLGEAKASLNYPYLHIWKEILSGARKNFHPKAECPVFYVYGKRKVGPFHSMKWLRELSETEGCEYKAYDCGHWITEEMSEQLNADITPWLLKAKL
eukprot:Hpha_TRINITY_DN35187_c0_g1::TRINITY_DN35187_c0_g1_i1::g.168490::m.168490